MSESSRGRPRKVSRLIEENGLEEVGDGLKARWLGKHGSRESLRTLADWFNQQLMRQAIMSSDMDLTAEEIEILYQTFIDPETSSGTRTQIRRRLSQNEIDVEALESDFVSRQAIHTYLTKDRGVERVAVENSTIDQAADVIGRLLSRTEEVTEDKLERLSKDGELDLGDVLISADLTITCRDCGTQSSIDGLLQTGGCDCSGEID